MRRLACIGLIFLVFIVFVPLSARAQDDSSKRYQDIQNQIKELEGKLSETKNREKTLSSQISFMDNQMRLTVLKIDATQKKVDDLTVEIASLSAKIDRLETSLTEVSDVLISRIVATYKRSPMPTLDVFFGNPTFNDFLLRLKYIRTAQTHDKRLMFQMQETKDNFTTQKALREDKKREQEQLKVLLESEKATLAQQRKDKEGLLLITRSDEKRYQELLAAARAEQQAIESALRLSLANRKDGTAIKKGEQIALIGNSGAPYCSTGTHLHFEVRKNDAVQNPAGYLKSINVEWNNSPDGSFGFSGDWDWPIGGPRITQGFGMTYWARTGFYGGGPHTGIDMTSSEGSIIRAPRDGTLYRGTVNCRGIGMNYVAIDHGDGLASWYFHIQ